MDSVKVNLPSSISSPIRLSGTWGSGYVYLGFNSTTGSSREISGDDKGQAGYPEPVGRGIIGTLGAFGPLSMNRAKVSSSTGNVHLTSIRASYLSTSKTLEESTLSHPGKIDTNLLAVQYEKPELRVLGGNLYLGVQPFSGSPRSQPYLLSSSTSNVTRTKDGFYRVSPLPPNQPTTPSRSFHSPSVRELTLPLSQTFSALPSLSLAPPSPSPSFDLSRTTLGPSLPRSRRVFGFSPLRKKTPRTKLTPKNAGSPHSNERSPFLGTTPNSPPSSPTRPQSLIIPYTPTPPGTMLVSMEPCYPDGISVQTHATSNTLRWLHATVQHVEFCLDQESFRAVRASFRLAGFSEFGRTLDPDRPCETADFMPVRRQSFFFHHSTLDPQPIMRRLIVNGEQSRDYMSRHGSLCLKANGVYTIRGTESSALLFANANGETKLKWRFDYVVDDRRNANTGNVIPGEKTVTPLTFSCSPLMLHPSQGKKVKFLYIVKKNVAGKLASEKVEPPSLPRPCAPVPFPDHTTTSASPGTPSAAQTSNARPWRRHRRTQSHGLKVLRDDRNLVASEVQGGAQPLTIGKENDSAARHRRRVSSGFREVVKRSPLRPLPTD